MTFVRHALAAGILSLGLLVGAVCALMWFQALNKLNWWEPEDFAMNFDWMVLFVLPVALVLFAVAWAIWPVRSAAVDTSVAPHRLVRVLVALASLTPLVVTLLVSWIAWTTPQSPGVHLYSEPGTSPYPSRESLALRIGEMVVFAAILAAVGVARARFPRASGAVFWRAIALLFVVYGIASGLPGLVTGLQRGGDGSRFVSMYLAGLGWWTGMFVACALVFALSFARGLQRRVSSRPAGPDGVLSPRPEAS